MPRAKELNTKIAYSYVRFSSMEQGAGDSLRRQTIEAEKWAHENGYTIKELQFEDRGRSAYNASHLEGAFGRFLKAIEAGVVKEGDTLLVESLDRLSRDEVLEALGHFSRILKQGVQIITYSDRRIYTRETASDMGTIMYSIMVMARAHEESVQKAYRLQKSWAAKRAKAKDEKITRIGPYWLKFEDGKFVPVEERVRIVRQIFTQALEGVGVERIAKALNDAGVAAWRIKKDTGRDNGWHRSYILKILHNRAVLGEFQPHERVRFRKPTGAFKFTRKPVGEPIKDYFPKIITEDAFQRVQIQLTTRVFVGAGRKGDGLNLFPHICKCGNCGGSVNFVNKGRYKYLACDNARRKLQKPKPCEYITWTYENFEKSFWAFIRGLDYSRIAVADYTSHLDMAQLEYDGVSSQIEAERKRLDKLMTVVTNNSKVPDRILTEMSNSETKIRELENRLKNKSLSLAAIKEKQLGGGVSWEEFKEMNLSTPEARERARREIRDKIGSISIDFAGASAFTKCRPSFTVKFHKEYDREYVVVPNEQNPTAFHMLIEYADGEANGYEPDESVPDKDAIGKEGVESKLNRPKTPDDDDEIEAAVRLRIPG